MTAVPVGAFYLADGPTHFARFCLAKREAMLDEAISRLAKAFGGRMI